MPLKKVEETLFSRRMTGIEKGFTYWVEGRGVRSEEYEVEVVELPVVIGLNLKYLYPSYTGLPPLMVKGRGDVTALVGTVIELRGESTRELTSAHLVFDDTMRVMGRVEGRKFGGDFTVRGDGTYHIDISDSFGNRNEDPIEYQISSIYDEPPTAEVEEPGRDIDLPRSMVVALSIHVTDDFGLTEVLLGFSKAEEERKSLIADLGGERAEATLDHSWDLSSLGLLPGDVLRYWVEVWDNDTYGGPKRGVSPSYIIRFPTLEEIYREVARGEEKIAEEIGAILPQQEELSEKLEQLSLELKKTKELGWEERRAAEELVAKQKEIAEKIRDVLDTLEETLESMKNSIVVDQETLDKLAELRRLWEEVETEEMRDAMERLREALKALKPEDIEKAMRKLSLSQEELKRRLERTLEVLKRLQQEQRLKALVEKAEELLREQKEIREETEKAREEELDKLSQREEKLRGESESLKEELEDLAEELSPSDPEVSQSLESLSKAMEGKRLSQKMSEVSSSLARGDSKRTIPLQEDIAQQLSELSAGLSSALSRLLASRKSEIEKAIVKAAGDLLYLSKEEEELSKTVFEGRESPNLDPGELARTEQSLMEGVRKVAEELYKASRKSFFITPDVGRALSSSILAMEEAQGALEKGNLLAAERASENAVQRLNLAIEELFKSQGQLSSCGSASGLEAALSKMAGLSGEQMGVNEAVQGLLPSTSRGEN